MIKLGYQADKIAKPIKLVRALPGHESHKLTS